MKKRQWMVTISIICIALGVTFLGPAIFKEMYILAVVSMIVMFTGTTLFTIFYGSDLNE